MSSRQTIAEGDRCVARRAAAERAALREKARTCRAMNGAVDAPPPSTLSLAALTTASTASVVMSARIGVSFGCTLVLDHRPLALEWNFFRGLPQP
jgi:hypothetical protein